jgi:hypothetical protein
MDNFKQEGLLVILFKGVIFVAEPQFLRLITEQSRYFVRNFTATLTSFLNVFLGSLFGCIVIWKTNVT